ncbi:MAG: immunoglobulin domain-containing protein, partial [Verrucomicrobiota bacterium]
GLAANLVAKWDGTSWTNLGDGLTKTKIVYALAFGPDGNLYAGGSFTNSGDRTVNLIAKWDGTAWTNLSDGLTKTKVVFALAMAANGDLYAGGSFTNSGGLAVSRVAKWVQTWIEGSGVNPDNGPIAGGTQVTITGNGLSDDSADDITNVTFCGVAVTNIESQCSTQVVVWTGPGYAGLGDVRVFSINQGETVKSNAFTYTGPGMTVLGTNDAVIANGVAASAEKGTDFGTVTLDAALTNTLAITNAGTETLTISSITTNGAGAALFRVTGLPAEVQAGTVSNFNLVFNASAEGVSTAMIAIANNSATPDYSFGVQGTVTVPDTPAAITADPQSLTRNEGSTASFTVTASGTAPLFYQWQKNGGNIFGATHTNYTIASVAAGHAADYRCIVSNIVNVVTSAVASLTVNTSPTITSDPQSQTKAPGESVTFSVTASGTAPLFYQWQKDAADIGGATADSYTIASVAAGDAGDYRCVVTNTAGTATSAAATLTVSAAPFITADPQSLTRNPGSAASFSVTASGTAPLFYQWQKDAANIGGATADSYTIASVAAGDAGSYRCVVTNTVGMATSAAATLTVNDSSLPDVPTGISASDGAYYDKVRITWSAASGATGYEVWRSISNDTANASNLVTTTAITYDDLTAATTPGTILYYWVKAVNAAGASDFSAGDSGYVQPAIGPTIKANGAVGDVSINYPDAMAVTIEMNEDPYGGAPVEWWVLSLAGSSWYYLNNAVEWTQFDGNLSNCGPLYQGASCNLPAYLLPELNVPGLPVSSYTFWFAVDSQMDGNLDVDEQTMVDSVNVTMLSASPAPCIKANGKTGAVNINYPETVAITVEMDARAYAGVSVDWWVLVCANGTWFYMDSVAGWTQGGAWSPVLQGALVNLPAIEVLNMAGLGAGLYTFFFAVDLPMDGILNMEQIWVDSVNVIVQ